ncbi:helix-turn-helix transcriptional regulator [Micromonospora zhanjiangensis]
MTTVDPRTVDGVRPVLGERAGALLAGVAADPYGPLCLALPAPGGHGKTVLLDAFARAYRRAGLTVLTEYPIRSDPDRSDPDRSDPDHSDGNRVDVDRSDGDRFGPDRTELDRVGAGRLGADQVLLLDDAHLLDEARLRALGDLLESGPVRLVVGYRPWPQPPALARLVDLLRRHGQPLPLPPFTPAQTAAHLADTVGLTDPAVARFVQAQTGGVPRDVERLARGVREHAVPVPGGTGRRAERAVPRSVVLELGPDLDALGPDTRALLLAAAAGGPLPVELLAALLRRDPAAVGEAVAEAAAAGLLGPDGRLAPLVARAIATLAPAAARDAVWQRLTELRLARGGPVLPLVRTLRAVGADGGYPAAMLAAAAEEALADDPGYAAELFAAAAADGRGGTARQAAAAALAGDLDAALRLADRLIGTANPASRAEAATVAATALAHRGQLARSAELYRWAGTATSLAHATVGAVGTGRLDEPFEPPVDEPPTLLAGAANLTARGLRETLTGAPTAALSAFVQAAALLEPAGRAALLPDSPAALAALTALHCGELEIGARVLDRAVAARTGGPLLARRHRLLRACVAMLGGRTAAAAEETAAAVADGRPLEPRDLLLHAALQVGIARRNSDLPTLRRAWGYAREAVLRHPVDLFTLLPLGELAVAAARLGELDRLGPQLAEARAVLHRLGDPVLWSTPLHWNLLHAAIAAEHPAAADEHTAALRRAAGHGRYAAALAGAADAWRAVLRADIDPVRVEAAARELSDVGLCWDAARLAGQAAIRTTDRRAMTTLLECARALQGRPSARAAVPPEQPSAAALAPTTGMAGTAGVPAAAAESPLSEREREVAGLVLDGLTYRQIGDRLFISAKTVEHHVARMRSRLNCTSRPDLLARLREILTDAG